MIAKIPEGNSLMRRLVNIVLVIILFINQASFACAAELNTADSKKLLKQRSLATISTLTSLGQVRLTLEEQQWLQDNSIIEFANSNSWPPYSKVAQEAGRSINQQLLAIINKQLGTNFTFKTYKSWSKAVDDVKTGTISGIFSLSWTAERAKYINYSPRYFYTPYALVVHNDTQDIKRFADLNKKTLASLRGFVVADAFKKQLPNTTIIYADSKEQIYQLVRNGTADAVISASPDPHMLKHFNLKSVNSVYTQEGDLAIGTTKQQPMLAQIIAKAISAIPLDEFSALSAKWLSSKPKQTLFTAAERHYIVANPVVTVGVESWAPIIFSNDGHKIKGIAGDILSEISKTSGLTFKVKTGLWSTLLDQFRHGDIDLLPVTYKNQARQKYGLFSDPYFDLASSIFVASNNNSIKTMSDLVGLKLAIVKGYATIKTVAEKFPAIDIIETNNDIDSISRLLNGEVDAILQVDIVIFHALKIGLIQGIKSIRQTDIPKEPLHLFSRLDSPLLQSILNKSMYTLSHRKRLKIIDKWLNNPSLTTELKIALGSGRAPYTLEKQSIKGLEYHLISKILAQNNINVTIEKRLPLDLLKSALHDDQNLDAAVTIFTNGKNYFYSDKFISFNNVVVTRKKQQLTIKNSADLASHSVAAFAQAYKLLGLEYFSQFNPDNRPSSYQELIDQQQQVNLLIDGKVDALVIDQRIFNWFAAKAGYPSMKLFDFHKIYPNNTQLVVGFRSEKIRDIFNSNLSKLKKSGEYQYIINDYDSGHIIEKTELASVVASLLSKFIVEDKKHQLASLTTLISSLEYISKVEVFNNNDLLIHSSSALTPTYYKQADSYNISTGVTEKVGHVRVYFNNAAVKKQLNLGSLIPDISLFNQHQQYRYIWELYRRFNFLEQKIYFTDQENSYLLARPTLTFSQLDSQPLAIINQNKMSGFIGHYLEIITEKTGIKFKYSPSNSWDDILMQFRNNQLDLVPSVVNSATVADIGVTTNQYANFHFAIVMANDASYVGHINDLTDKTIALPKGYTSHQYVASFYPEANIIETTDIKQALTLVRNGSADAFIGHLMVAAYQLENEFSQLKIAGLLEDDFGHRMLLRKDNQILKSIINKVLNSISTKQHQAIRNQWFQRKINTATDYGVIYRLVAIFGLILGLIFYIYNKLARAKRLVEQSNTELEQSIIDLNQAQQKLIESEKMASLGGLVAGIAHEINTPVGIGLTAMSHFVGITNELQSKYRDKKLSQQDFDNYLLNSVDAAEIVNRNLERTAELVKSFKLISVDQSSDEQRTFNVNNYVHEILISINHVLKKSNLDIRVHCDEELTIKSFPGALSQIISNLLINSTIHGFPDNQRGTVDIVITCDDGVIKLIYRDDGIGIKAQDLTRIFEPFFTTNREKGGSGLGLNIIYNIVTTRLGGTINCVSTPERGVEFNIKFTP